MKMERKHILLIIIPVALILAATILLVTLNHHDRRDDQVTSMQKKRLKGLMDSINLNYYKVPVKRLDYISKTIAIAIALNDSNALAKSYYYKASCYLDLEKPDSVLPYCEKAQVLAGLLKNQILIAKTTNVIANLYLDKDDYYRAMVALKSALKIFEEKGDKHDIGVVYNGLGLVYSNLKEYDKSITYYIKADEIFRALGKEREQAVIKLNIAGCYVEKNNVAKANYYYKQSLQTFGKIQDSVQIVATYINMSNGCRKNGNLQEAAGFLDRAIYLSTRMNNQRLMGSSYYNRGALYFDAGDLVRAKEFVERGLAFFKKIGLREGEMLALKSLSEIQEKTGNYKLSLGYYKGFTDIQNEILNGDTRKQIADLQWKYDLQKNEYETRLLLEKYTVKQKQTLFLSLSLGLFFILAILIGILIRLAYKNLKKSVRLTELENIHLNEKMSADQRINHLENLRLTSEIDAMNRELTATSLQLISKNEILADIYERNEQYFKKETMGREPYNDLKHILKENLNQDKDWVHFKELFVKVHRNFFNDIKNRCPELTENELRMCAYLRINLRNKEIAKMLNILPESVKTIRYHIRKKLKIDKDISLEDFIRGI
ncbi:MAG: tetratricopeptide repeat protein [Bacteroidales bacterium]|nr:tetratricopeptide repeat protein [Bacteroidales bacterium]